MQRRSKTISLALTALLLVIACNLPAAGREILVAQQSQTVTVTSTPSPEPTLTPTVTTVNCYYNWAYRVDAEGAGRVRHALETAGLVVEQANVQLFGEDHICTDGSVTFGMMDSTLILKLASKGPGDPAALGRLLRDILAAEGVLSVARHIELTLAVDEATVRMRLDSAGAQEKIDKGMTETELWLALNSDLAMAGVAALVFSPDGSQILTSSSDGSLRLWDAHSGQLVRVILSGGNGGAVAFSPDGDFCYHAADSVRVFRLEDGSLVSSVDSPAGPVQSLALSPDGKMLAGSSVPGGGSDNPGILVVWAVEGPSLRLLYTQPEARLTALAFSPDSAHLAASAEGFTVRVLEPASGREAYRLDLQRPAPDSICNAPLNAALAFSADGKALAASFCYEYVDLFDTAGRSLKVTLQPPSPLVRGVAFSPTGGYLAVASRAGAELRGPETGELIKILKKPSECVVCEEEASLLAFSPDGGLLAVAVRSGVVRVWQVESGELAAEFGM